MSGKLREVLSPYSFRDKTRVYLIICIIAASLISLLGVYAYSNYAVRVETTKTEYSTALALLELEQKTELPLEELLEMAGNEDLQLQILQLPDQFLTASQLDQLETRTILAVVDSSTGPFTFVKMQDEIVLIQTANHNMLLLNNFMRPALTGLLFSIVFLMMSFLSSSRIARPVSQLTRAVQHVSKGDFSIQLPEDQDDEMGNLMRSFNRMTDALEKTSSRQKDFISSVSHEFRTPIASIKGYARLLKTEGLDEEKRQEYTDMIAQEADRLSRLSETLLRLSALEQQTDPASISTFRLDEQVRQVLLRMEPQWSAHDIEFDLDLQELTVESDAELLNQVWTNLIQNAIKFSPDESQIHVAVRKNGEQAEFEVTDHGIGMSEETQRRIFDRFYQGDRSRSREGVGLGMSLVRRILNILNGEISIQSELNKGTTMIVRLPMHSTAAEKKEAEHA